MKTSINAERTPRILGVFAHPDESFCAGGALAAERPTDTIVGNRPSYNMERQWRVI